MNWYMAAHIAIGAAYFAIVFRGSAEELRGHMRDLETALYHWSREEVFIVFYGIILFVFCTVAFAWPIMMARKALRRG